MDAAKTRCAKIRQVYENCFRTWYSEQFMKGDISPGCQDEFLEYRECVVEAMKEKEKQGLKLPEAERPAN